MNDQIKKALEEVFFNLLTAKTQLSTDSIDELAPALALAALEAQASQPTGKREERYDWPEDFAHENGKYQNICCNCGVHFIGYKRRVICKVCAVDAPKEVPVSFGGIDFVLTPSMDAPKPEAAQPVSDADKFCDGNCTWLDHHPSCIRALKGSAQSSGSTK